MTYSLPAFPIHAGLLAHAGHMDSAGFLSGIAHPVFGPDHLLAIFCVGLLSLRAEGRVRIQIPILFLLMLLSGAWVGLQSWLGEPMEALLALSVTAVGLALLFPERAKSLWLFGVVVGTGFLHGYAHGAEAPPEQAVAFFAGFFVGSTILLGAGLLVSLALYEVAAGSRIRRALGGMAGFAGLFFLSNLFLV